MRKPSFFFSNLSDRPDVHLHILDSLANHARIRLSFPTTETRAAGLTSANKLLGMCDTLRWIDPGFGILVSPLVKLILRTQDGFILHYFAGRPWKDETVRSRNERIRETFEDRAFTKRFGT